METLQFWSNQTCYFWHLQIYAYAVNLSRIFILYFYTGFLKLKLRVTEFVFAIFSGNTNLVLLFIRWMGFVLLTYDIKINTVYSSKKFKLKRNLFFPFQTSNCIFKARITAVFCLTFQAHFKSVKLMIVWKKNSS